MQYHEAANLFPLMQGSDFDDLVADIKANGLLKPIELFENQIIDGRNRYKACQQAGVEPKYSHITLDIDPFAYVWALNAERRHLPSGQKVTIKFLQLKKSDQFLQEQEAKRQAANEARRVAQVSIPIVERRVSYDTRRSDKNWTRTQVAAVAGVSSASAARAQSLVNKRPDLAEKVASGEVTFTAARRQAKKDELPDEIASLPQDKYSVIYADPPWSYNNKLGGDISDSYGAAEKHYPCMSMSELIALPVSEISNNNSVIFLWATSPLLPEALKIMSSWGFNYKASFVWDKVLHNMGHYNSVRHEFLLIGTRGSFTPENVKLFDSVQSIERTKHSEKPEEFRTIIETLYPSAKKIELFRRGGNIDGWDVWGNETVN